MNKRKERKKKDRAVSNARNNLFTTLLVDSCFSMENSPTLLVREKRWRGRGQEKTSRGIGREREGEDREKGNKQWISVEDM